jgi:hypothetical protein
MTSGNGKSSPSYLMTGVYAEPMPRGGDAVRFEDQFVVHTNIVQRAISRWDTEQQAGRRIGRLDLIFMRW